MERKLSSPSFLARLRQSALLRPLNALMDAFVDVVEPALSRILRRRRCIAVETEGGELSFFFAAGKRIEPIGAGPDIDDRARRILAAASGADLELRLAPGRITTARLQVPASGRDFVEQIIESRLENLTPFRPERVLYGYALTPSTENAGQLEVTLAATSTDIAEASLATLAHHGLVPSVIGTAAEPLEERLRIDLFRGARNAGRRKRRVVIASIVWLVMAAGLISYLVTGQLAAASAEDLAAIEARLTDIRQRLVHGTGADGSREEGLALIASKTPARARFVQIDRLAAILPDTTFLDQLDILPDSLRLAGTSADAASLIAILEAEPALESANFSAPVTRDPDGRDRFDITARFKPLTEAAVQ